MRKNAFYLGIVVIMLALAGCRPFSEVQQGPELDFEIAMQVNSDQEFHVTLGVRNAGNQEFEGDNTFNGQMEVRYLPSGELRASAEVIPLPSIAADETVWPMDWHAQLEPGTYEITWGAEGYGATTEEFTVVERDGRLYLGEEGLVIAEPGPSPIAAEPGETTEEQDALVAQAVSDLQEGLGVDAGEITVVGVEATEFPDASLGVPEPGKSYAQTITPGFVITLEARGETYEYHGADERVVLVPREDEEPSAEQPIDDHQTVTVPELGMTFEVPAHWSQLEPELAWVPEAGSQRRLGFNATVTEPPIELEAALLPYDAQILDSEPLDLSWAEGRRFTLEVYGPATEGGDTKAPVDSVQTHVLLTLNRGDGRLGLDFYASAPSAEQLRELEPGLQHMLDTAELVGPEQGVVLEADQAWTADWQLFEAEVLGEACRFRFKIPQDWTYKEMQTQGPGVPEDWPMVRSVSLFPQAWSDRFEQSGPPDPEAPPAIAIVSLEVCVGAIDQFRRVYPRPIGTQTLEINGITAVREAERLPGQGGLIRYVFQHPEDEHIRIVLNDALNGFSARAREYPELAALIPDVVATFEFVD